MSREPFKWGGLAFLMAWCAWSVCCTTKTGAKEPTPTPTATTCAYGWAAVPVYGVGPGGCGCWATLSVDATPVTTANWNDAPRCVDMILQTGTHQASERSQAGAMMWSAQFTVGCDGVAVVQAPWPYQGGCP